MSLDSGRITILDANQIADLLTSARGPRDRSLIWVLSRTGCRLQEALSLDWGDIGDQEITIPWLKCRGRRRARTIPLPGARAILREWLGDAETDADRLWPIHASTAWRWVRSAAARANLARIHPHSLRHAYACEWLRRGGDLTRLQHWLGHATLATTSLYLHSCPADLAAESRRIGMPSEGRPPVGKRRRHDA